jgi:anti-sigma-K factor RskA
MYVLDQLDEAAQAEVEKLAALHPEIRQEIVEVEEALGTYHTLSGLTPPQHILSNVLQATAPKAAVLSPTAASRPLRHTLPYWLVAAAILGFVAATGLWFSQQSAHKQAQALQKELWATRSKEQACAEREQFLQKQVEILSRDSLQRVVVKAGQQAIAAVYWDKKQRTAHLGVLNLSDPGKEKQYQLWAFVKGQEKPLSLGVVAWEELQKGLVSFSFVQKPELFAISLEKFGGSPTPTDVKGASGAVI